MTVKQSRIVAVLLFGLLVVSLTSVGPKLGAWFSHDSLDKSNHAYLQQVERSAREDALLLAELSSVLSIVQSSDIGISFIAEMQVTLGEALAPLNRTVEQLAEVSMLTAIGAYTAQLVLKVNQHLTFPLYILALVSVIACLLAAALRPNSGWLIEKLKRIAGLLSLSLVILYLVIPYGIHVTAMVDHAVVKELRWEASQNLQGVHHEITKQQGKKGDLKESAKQTIHTLSKMKKGMETRVELMVTTLVSKVAIMLLQGLFLPLLFVYLGYRSAVAVFREAHTSLALDNVKLKGAKLAAKSA